jgi:hypothetical protein
LFGKVGESGRVGSKEFLEDELGLLGRVELLELFPSRVVWLSAWDDVVGYKQLAVMPRTALADNRRKHSLVAGAPSILMYCIQVCVRKGGSV